jgi:hypothetical protein
MSFFRSNKYPGPKGSHYAIVAVVLGVVLFSCKSQYCNLKQVDGDVNCIKKFSPKFKQTLYSAYVDVTRHHFSGILYFKLMPDSSMRVVFTNEMGIKFFDFGFTSDNHFTKYYILPEMDKKVVVTALRKDMELALLRPDIARAKILEDAAYTYIAVPDKGGHDYYVTEHCEKLVRIEKSSKRKPVEIIQLFNYRDGVPDSIDIQHKNFKFRIALKRIEKENTNP